MDSIIKPDAISCRGNANETRIQKNGAESGIGKSQGNGIKEDEDENDVGRIEECRDFPWLT